MEMNVRDDQKLVEIWLTNAEKIDPVLREGLKEIYAKYKTKKYMVAVFESGVGYQVETVRGFKNVLFGGEGLFLTALQGPGKVWLQTLSLPAFAGRLLPFLPAKSNND